jgi:hypothetical protein
MKENISSSLLVAAALSHSNAPCYRAPRMVFTAFTRWRASLGINIALPDLVSEGAWLRLLMHHRRAMVCNMETYHEDASDRPGLGNAHCRSGFH